jgi:hypothetical protein
MDGEPIEFWWDHDEDDALRVENVHTSILIFTTDTIKADGDTIIVTMGAKDYEFKV